MRRTVGLRLRGVSFWRRVDVGEAVLVAVVVTGLAWLVGHPAWWVLAVIFAVWFLIGLAL